MHVFGPMVGSDVVDQAGECFCGFLVAPQHWPGLGWPVQKLQRLGQPESFWCSDFQSAIDRDGETLYFFLVLYVDFCLNLVSLLKFTKKKKNPLNEQSICFPFST